MEKSILSKRLAGYFNNYASFHKTKGNQTTHMIGIPLIVISLLGLLAKIKFGVEPSSHEALLQWDGGILLTVFGVIFYLYMDWKIAIPFSLVILGCYFIGRAIPSPVNGALFVGGWIFQLVGHAYYEKNRPAFLKNFEHLLIGPLWIFAKITGYR